MGKCSLLSSEILADETQKFVSEKVKSGKFPTDSEKFSEIGGNLKHGGKCIIASEGIDAPGRSHNFTVSPKNK